MIINYDLPLAEMVLNFYDRLKSVPRLRLDGLRPDGDKAAESGQPDILINSEPVDSLSLDRPQRRGVARRGSVHEEKLKEVIERQHFEVASKPPSAGGSSRA